MGVRDLLLALHSPSHSLARSTQLDRSRRSWRRAAARAA
jgi:hypothetical protein